MFEVLDDRARRNRLGFGIGSVSSSFGRRSATGTRIWFPRPLLPRQTFDGTPTDRQVAVAAVVPRKKKN